MCKGATQKLKMAKHCEVELEKRLDKAAGGLNKLISAASLGSNMVGSVLKMTTKYDTRSGVEGTIDLGFMALRRSPASLSTDEKELQYLYEKIQGLEQKETTGLNFRDVVDTWISILQLRASIRAECAQAILSCMTSDGDLLLALGTGQGISVIDGEPPPILTSIISKQCGGHVRKNAYRYLKRISGELVKIQRVKDMQMRLLGFLGTTFIAACVSLGNLFSRIMYEGFFKDMTGERAIWLIPAVLVVSLLVSCAVGGSIYFCVKGSVRLYSSSKYGRISRIASVTTVSVAVAVLIAALLSQILPLSQSSGRKETGAWLVPLALLTLITIFLGAYSCYRCWKRRKANPRPALRRSLRMTFSQLSIRSSGRSPPRIPTE